MRKWGFLLVILLLCSSLVSAEGVDGYVSDYAGVLSGEEKSQLERMLKGLHEQGAAEIAVVTVSSLEGKPIENVAFEMAEGVLGDKEKNNGLLLLVAVEDRKYRFEVGRGLEGVLNDAKVGRIGRVELVPAFRSGEYGKGILSAMSVVSSIVSGEADPTESYPPEGTSVKLWLYLGFFLVFFVILPIVNFVWFFRKRRRQGDDYFAAALMAVSLLNSRGRGGSGGGGFGGFGGGSFGGGGASGGW